MLLKGVDPHRDGTCEILHTYLLGNNKYVFYETNKGWDNKKLDLFATRLGSSSIDGLSISSLRSQYIVQFKNALVGKHFKALQQLAVFHLHDGLCSDILFDLWKATGEAGALLWYHEIKNLPQYLVCLSLKCLHALDDTNLHRTTSKF